MKNVNDSLARMIAYGFNGGFRDPIYSAYANCFAATFFRHAQNIKLGMGKDRISRFYALMQFDYFRDKKLINYFELDYF